MKILFDECVPRRLKRVLPNHSITTAPEAGWAGIKNGELLKLAAETFEDFITVDRNLSFQQNPVTLPMPVFVVHSHSNKLSDLEPFIPQIVTLLNTNIAYILKENSTVKLSMYDLLGYMVQEWKFGAGEKGGTVGPNLFQWDGSNSGGSKVAAGGYILRIEVIGSKGSTTVIRKIGVIN